MPRFFGKLVAVQIDTTKLTKALEKHIQVVIRRAFREFLRAAIPYVPVDSGMARGSFLNIGRALNVAVPIPRKSFNKKYHTGQIKSPELGASLSTPADNVFKFENGKVKVEFDSRVLHYNLNEFSPLPSNYSVPWQSFEYGRAAFFASIKSDLKKFKNLKKYIITTNYTLGRDRVIKQKVEANPEQINIFF